ncbi:MAG TPA: hypothetical protein VLM05_07985 [Mycobacteriales bacterium]|nr:hypothetical protein [Mycobacteriales bacterium]
MSVPRPGDRLMAHVTGRVSRGVARVLVTWPGAAPVVAAVEGPRFLARGPLQPTPEGTEPADRPALVVAYDAAGHPLGSTN